MKCILYSKQRTLFIAIHLCVNALNTIIGIKCEVGGKNEGFEDMKVFFISTGQKKNLYNGEQKSKKYYKEVIREKIIKFKAEAK